MGQQGMTMGFAIAGSIIGSFTGVGAMVGGMIGSMAGGLIGSALFGGGSTKINDAQMGNSSYGNVIPILYGTARLSGQIIWMSESKSSGGGKGKGGMSSGGGVVHYHQSAAFLFCEGPAKLVQIYLDGNLFWDASNPTREIVQDNHTFLVRHYEGTEDQLPDPTIAAWVQDNVPGHATPAYRGMCIMVFRDVDLINYGNRMPVVTAVWTSTGTSSLYVQPLLPAPSAFPGLLPTGGTGNKGVVADWLSGMVYALDYTDIQLKTGNLIAYSVATGHQVLSVPFSSFTVEADDVVQGLAIGQGGQYLFVYGATNANPSGSTWIRALNPVTLKPAAPAVLFFEFDAGLWNVTVIEVQSASGSREALLLDQPYGHMALATVLMGGDIEQPTPIQNDTGIGFDSGKAVIVGPFDIQTGQTLYVMINGFIDPLWGAGTEIGRIRTDGSSTLGMELLGAITPAMFGGWVASPGSQFNIYGWHDPSDGTLVLADFPFGGDTLYNVIKINPDALAAGENPVIWGATLPGLDTWVNVANQVQSVTLYNGTIAFRGIGIGWILLDTATGTYKVIPDVAGSAGSPIAWDGAREAMLIFTVSGNLSIVYFNYVAVQGVALADIITDECGRVGLTPDMIDVSELTETAAGYVVKDQRSAGQSILDLLHTYSVDMIESDYKLKFVPRGQAAVATISQDELAPSEGTDLGKFWKEKIAPQQELPLVIAVKFADPALDYQPGAAGSQRSAGPVPTQFSKRRKTVDLPVVATWQDAKAIADRWLWTLWAERATYETALGLKYLWLDPADNVDVTFNDGSSITARIESIETGADLSMKLALASEDQNVYAAATPLATVPYGTLPQELPFQVYPTLLIVNLPLLRDADATDGTVGRVYFAVGANAKFGGATVYRYPTAAAGIITGGIGQPAIWGRATNALGDHPPMFSTDYLNTLNVTLIPGVPAPSSTSWYDLFNGANPAIVGEEVIQYLNATENDDGSYTLSTLLRGRRGTEWAIDSHVAGDLVILPTVATTGEATLPLSEIGVQEAWKLVPVSGTTTVARSVPFEYEAYDLKPYAPVHVVGVYSGSDIDLTWIRRTRIAGGLIDGTGTVALGETVEAYEVDILDAAGVTVLRTLSGLSSPAATYAAADITTDFGSAPDFLWVRVYQLSSAVGRGFALEWKLDLVSGLVASVIP